MLPPYNLLIAWLVSLLALHALGAKDKPDITSTEFTFPPVSVLQFEDSDTILITNTDTLTVFRSVDGGVSWKPLDGVEEGRAFEVLKHPYDKHVAIVLGNQKKHWLSRDRGETWHPFTVPEHPSRTRSGIAFHASDPERMIFHAQQCQGLFCEDLVYATTDGFATDAKELPETISSCMWAKSTDTFTTGDENLDKNLIVCMAKGEFSFFTSNNRVLMSSDFFEHDKIEPTMSDGRPVEGVITLAAAKRFIVFAARAPRTTELALYVTNSTTTWHRAEFGDHKLEEDAYTLLESTDYSLQVDVMTAGLSPLGVLLASESNGTFFTKQIEHTNRNRAGYVDFETVSHIQGIVLVNTVANWEDVEKKWDTPKKLTSHISFDDGRSWQSLKADGDDLHLHSITEQRNVGRLFSSPAPGIVMGIGNTGKHLKDYDEGDLYVSADAGVTWARAQKKPHLYEFGASGSVLVAVEQGEVDEIKWSLDYGKKWKKTELKDKVKPLFLTTTPDSTSLKFLMVATRGGGSDLVHLVYAIDFDGLHERKCAKGDLEKWPARVDKDGKPTCLMGHKQFFLRRKPDTDCLVVVEDFEDPKEETEECVCDKQDFECDWNFRRHEGACVPIGAVPAPEGACSGDQGKFKGPSGYRLIPGNVCTRKNGVELDKEEKEWDCSASKAPAINNGIVHTVTKFKGDQFIEYYYLERKNSERDDEETIIMRTDRRDVWLTHDHGKTWDQILTDDEILAIYPHQHIDDHVYMITPTDKVYYSKNWGKSIESFTAPTPPNRNGLQVLAFHPSQKDWLIWTGGRDCKSLSGECENIAYVSTHGGDEWDPMLHAVRKCQFVYHDESRKESDQLVYCEQYEDEKPGSSVLLLSSDDWFSHKKELKRDVINFATMAEYIVVAVRDEDQESLKVDTSIDGVRFADARFPKNLNVPHQSAYTVLDSSTHAVFLHVTVNNVQDREYGSIIKSNSNGTSYVLSISEVNRNPSGFVDFEKMQGLEGVAVVNRVDNVEETNNGAAKKLKTYITHNDGASWSLITRPADPPKGKGDPFGCSSHGEQCSLHLHGYTERKDSRDSFSSPSAVGLMIATGNVGPYLGFKKEADTFITTDGGVSWSLVREGNWMWEYGDQGSVIVLVKEDEPTDRVLYTLNEGADWKEYVFADDPMVVSDISTLPSDTSLKFVLWGKLRGSIVTVNLDFTGVAERSKQCSLDEEDPKGAAGDYYLWSPKHPMSDDDCLFGHVSEYHRKKVDRDCYNGREIRHLHNITKNCPCQREDFECDWNYEPGPNQACTLVAGAEQPDPAAVCAKDPELREYNGITGYRRIPLTTCAGPGGRELDFTGQTFPCPNYEQEFAEKHRLSGAGLFFAITLPIAAAAGVGYWVWRNWDGKFGRIQLGDGSAAGSPVGATHRDAPWVRLPVMAVAGLVAVIAAVPMLVGSLVRLVTTRLGRPSPGPRGAYTRTFTSRNSFARARGDRGTYAIADPDEGGLLGEDSDDEAP